MAGDPGETTMFEFVAQKRTTILLTALLAGMVVLMSASIHRTGRSSRIERIIAGASTPFVRAGAWLLGGVSGRWESLVELREARERSRRLDRELRWLQAERGRWEETRRENERLRVLLGLTNAIPARTVAARIVTRSPGENWTLLIDRGRGAGVMPGHAVIAPPGVVGKVISVTDSVSKVLLLNDPASGIAVAHQDQRYTGILSGTGGRYAELLYSEPNVKIASGDVLVSSGLERIYPPGLPVARVLSTTTLADGSVKVLARPEIGKASLEEVLVLLTEKDETPP